MRIILYILILLSVSIDSVAQLKIIYPNGGEKLQAGSKVKINWWADNIYDDEMSRIEFSSNGGNKWIILDSFKLDYQYEWIIPNIISDSCLVKATLITDRNYKPPILWTRSYNGNLFSMKLTADGGYLAVGVKNMKGEVEKRKRDSWYYDGWVIKIDSMGVIEWSKNYGEVGNNSFYSVTTTKDEGYVAVGKYNLVPFLDDFNIFWIVKLDSNGEKIWERTSGENNNISANNVIESSNGELIICGTNKLRESSIKTDIRILKLNSKGDYIWERLFGGSSDDVVNSLLETNDNNYIIAGYTYSNDGDISGNNGLSDGWVMKIDTNGKILWSKVYGGSGTDKLNSISNTKDGGYLVAGKSNSSTVYRGKNDLYWIMKLDKDGNVLWERRYGTDGNDEAIRAIETDDGNFLVVGWSDGIFYYKGKNYGRKDYWILKFNEKGWIIWASNYGGSGTDTPFSLSEVNKGHYIIGGNSSSRDKDIDTNNGQGDFWIINIDENNYIPNMAISDSFFSIVNSKSDITNNDNNINFFIHPNFASNIANIALDLTENGETSLELYNDIGIKLSTILSGYQKLGRRTIKLDVSPYPSGQYYLKLTTSNKNVTKILEIQK